MFKSGYVIYDNINREKQQFISKFTELMILIQDQYIGTDIRL